MVGPSPSAQPVAPAVGMVLAERYRLESSLGAGGMAEVFQALDLIEGRRVAVKVLRPQLTESAEALTRFRREGQVLHALKNPAIVAIEAVHELPGGRVFIVMEILEGETLGARMKRGPMSAQELAPIVAGCAAGLSAAHIKGVVHRDLKPDNIFLAKLPNGRAGELQLKILDFGVSKVRGEEKLTQTGQVLGTPRYMSPEQLGAEAEIDPRVDVYALGVILYEALSGGKSPFVAMTPTDLIVAILNGKIVPLRAVKPDVPAALEAVVLRAMAKVRAARYASVTELAEAFFEAGDIQVKAPTKPQAGTNVLGSMRTVAFGASGSEAGASVAPLPTSERLAQGTFSELEAFDVRPVVRGTLEPASSSSDVPAVARVSMPGSASARVIPPTAVSPAIVLPEPAASGVGPTEPAAIPGGDRPRGDASRPVRADGSGVQRASMADGAAMAPEGVPMSRLPGGVVLVVVGLLAGGLAAGAVIATLTWLQQASGSMPAVPPPPPPSAVAAIDAGVADGGAPDAALAAVTAAAVVVPAGGGSESASASPSESASGSATAVAGSDSEGEGAEAGTRPRRAPRHTEPEGAEATEAPVDPIVAATRALGRGDAAECVDILDDVIARGGNPIALRRRADCLARMGDMREAIRDYQRFCRIVPDHPAIGEVREILEGLGQSCP